MKKTDNDKTQIFNLHYHIARGGHKTYEGTVKQLSDCFGHNSFLVSEDVNGKVLPNNKWKLVDGANNIILSGRNEIEAITGILDWDGEYNTDIVRSLEDCDEDELQLVIDAAKHVYVPDAVLSYARKAIGVDNDDNQGFKK